MKTLSNASGYRCINLHFFIHFFSRRTTNRFKGLIDITEACGVRRLEKGLWVRVMRGICPDGFILAVKGAVFWGRGAAQLWSDGDDGGGEEGVVGGGRGVTIGGDATSGEQRWENGK